MRLRFASGLLLAGLLLAGLGPSRAMAEPTPGQKAYMDGVRAYDSGDHPSAVRLLRAAIQEDPAEGLRKFRYRGLVAEDYLPHFHLGLALAEVGDPAAARASLAESERQGIIRERAASYRVLQVTMRKLEPPPPVPTSIPPAIPASPRPTPEATVGAFSVQRAAPAPVAAALPASTRGPAPAARSVAGEAEAKEALREGLRSFFRAEYGQAARRLEPLAGRYPVARRFLALSLAARYVLEGRRDAALLGRAREDWNVASRRAGGAAAELLPPSLVVLLDGR